jgi:hypothetical protein
MMREVAAVIVAVVVAGPWTAWAHSEHEHGAVADDEQEASIAPAAGQTLTGEVVDVFCYLSHGNEGLGKGHAGCAKKCIQRGLPVAIKVGDRLYLASMADHTAANQKLADLAGEQVTVRGQVMERDGQHLIAVSQIEPAE